MVLAIEDVANDEDKAFLIGTLIIRIVEHLRLRASDAARPTGLRHVIVIEEAHRLLRAGREGASAHAVELFASLLAEIRAYGEGIVIAEQIPAKLVPDVVKNTALKVRAPAARAATTARSSGAAMNLDEDQSRQVVSLRPGVAAVFADGMDRPLRIRVPFGGGRERASTDRRGARRRRRSAAAGRRPAARPARRAAPARCWSCARPTCSPARPSDAWLRVWAEALVLAYLTNRPLPVVPAPLRQRWSGLDARLRECLLATALDRSLAGPGHGGAGLLRPGPARGRAAPPPRAGCWTAARAPGTTPGADWVIPQLQWLHEIERVVPAGRRRRRTRSRPRRRLDFPLPGLADRAGRARSASGSAGCAGTRCRWSWPATGCPPGPCCSARTISRASSMTWPPSRSASSHRGQLRKAAGEMGIAGWLESVLSWPRRFIVGADDQASGLAVRQSAEPRSPDSIGGHEQASAARAAGHHASAAPPGGCHG